MLDGLRHHTLVGSDDEKTQVNAAGTDDHAADEILVTRHIDDADSSDTIQLERREAEVDRDTTSFLFRQSICIDARESFDERRFAVVDMTGRADYRTAPTGGTSSSSQLRIVVRAPDGSRRPAGASLLHDGQTMPPAACEKVASSASRRGV